jgi:hypothetical protein
MAISRYYYRWPLFINRYRGRGVYEEYNAITFFYVFFFPLPIVTTMLQRSGGSVATTLHTRTHLFGVVTIYHVHRNLYVRNLILHVFKPSEVSEI